jgi:hypothetical protein
LTGCGPSRLRQKETGARAPSPLQDAVFLARASAAYGPLPDHGPWVEALESRAAGITAATFRNRFGKTALVSLEDAYHVAVDNQRQRAAIARISARLAEVLYDTPVELVVLA